MGHKREEEILGIIIENGTIGISGIIKKMRSAVSVPTVNRVLSSLKKQNIILAEGSGPAIKYSVNLAGLMTAGIDADQFFKIEPDERRIIAKYNPEIFNLLGSIDLFTKQELSWLEDKTAVYLKKTNNLTPAIYKKEFERLMIELSWKSSQMEGNTYDLLDTEQLLMYSIEATGHTAEEAMMLLNHKSAIEYTSENASFFKTVTVSKIVDIHALLVKDMGISKTIRQRLVRITGTKYTPPENQFITEEALEQLCNLVNAKQNVFEKALLAVLLISYIQPFDDGNKRTARLTANALLMAYGACPLSYRSVSPADFKKTILLFYELNNITAFKKIFISQYGFAVENYF